MGSAKAAAGHKQEPLIGSSALDPSRTAPESSSGTDAVSKAQSAMEYLMTYGWAILIIAIALAALFSLGVFNSSVPDACISTTGFLCGTPTLSSYGVLSTAIGQESGSSITIIGLGCSSNSSAPSTFQPVYIQVGPAQKATVDFNCKLPSSRIGSAFTGTLWIEYTQGTQGGTIMAELGSVTATVAFVSGPTSTVTTVSTTVSPTISITISTISTTLSTTISTISTTISTTVSTTISTTLSTTISTISTIYYVPITLTNSQSAATPAPFQQMIVVPSSTYSSYINSAWSNVQFTTGAGNTGTVLQAWVENNASNTAASTVVWVNLPSGIGASSGTTIYMDFMPSSVMSASGPTGEAPQLSSTYAQYDDGASVFNNYWNFAGTSLPSGWTSGSVSGSTVTVNNGLTISGNGTTAGSTYAATSSAVFNNNEILEGYINQNSGSTGNERGMLGISTVNNAEPVWDNSGGSGDTIAGWSAGKNGVLDIIQSETVLNGATTYLNSISYNSNRYIYSVALSSSNGVTTFVNYGSVSSASSTTSDNPSASLYVNLGVYNTGGGGSFNLQYTWLRTRAYPPSGVMPSVSFGSVA